MTTPDDATSTEVERVPLKVVPIYVQPFEPEPELEPEDEAEVVEEPAAPRRAPWVGVVSVLLAVATVVVLIFAVSVATDGALATGSTLAWVGIALSIAAVLTGLTAIIVRRGTLWGIIGIVLGLFANPFVLLSLLQLASGLRS